MEIIPPEILFLILDGISDSDLFHLALSSKPICTTLLESCKLQADIRNRRWVAAMERAMFSSPNSAGLISTRNTIARYLSALQRIRRHTVMTFGAHYTGLITDDILLDFLVHSAATPRPDHEQWFRQIIRACTVAMEHLDSEFRNSSLVQIDPAFCRRYIKSIMIAWPGRKSKSDKPDDGAIEALERQRAVQLELALATTARGRRIRRARVEALRADLWAAGWGRSAVTWCYVAFESPAGRRGRPAGRPAGRAGGRAVRQARKLPCRALFNTLFINNEAFYQYMSFLILDM